MPSKVLITISILAMAATLVWHVNIAEAQFVKEGLVSWWPFDRNTIGDDGTVEDSFGDNNGIIEGDVEIVGGRVGECLKFDTVDDFVTIEHSDSVDIGEGEYSVEAWIKAPTQPAGWWLHTIYAKGGTNWKAGYLIAVRGDKDAAGMGGFGVLVSREGGGTETYTDENVDDDEWHHVVGVFSRSSGEIKAYIDGKLEQAVAADKTIDLSTPAEARIGRSSQQSSDADWYSGCIDEVRLYNKALSDEEIRQNYYKGAAVFPTEKLSIAWGRIKLSD